MGTAAPQTELNSSPGRPDQAAWNEAIFDWYFGAHVAQRPVYLSVDDATLRAIAGSRGWEDDGAVESLSSSLRLYTDTDRPFHHWVNVAASWTKRGAPSPPPFVHILALTVLSATQRRRSEGLNGYYAPLFSVLGIDDTPGRRDDYRWSVPDLWRTLGSWLKTNNGTLGLPTARQGSHATEYLGYSVSQAIVRGADRAAFIEFFEQTGYHPGDSVEAGLLLARFERWAVRSQVSDRVRGALVDQERRSALAEVLRHDLETWAGESRDDNFRAVLRVVPRLNATRRTLTAVLRCPHAFDGLMDGDREIAPSGFERVFLDFPISLDPTVRREYLEVAGVRLQIRHGPVHAFEEDPLLGGYTAIDKMVSGRSAWLAVAKKAKDEMRFLVDRGFRVEEWSSLPGWNIVRNVRLDAREVQHVPDGLLPIMPASGLRTELRGGLALGNRRYLIGGPPDLVIPVSPLPLEVRLNGAVVDAIPVDCERVLPMAKFAMEAGSYSISVGDQVLKFELLDVRVWDRRTKVLCHVLLPSPPTLLDLTTEVLEDEVTVSGAAIRIGLAEAQPVDGTSWPPATDGWVAFESNGEYAEVAPAPRWIAQIGQSPCHTTLPDVLSDLRRPAKWLARVMRSRVNVSKVGEEGGPEVVAAEIAMFGNRAVQVPRRLAAEWNDFVALLPSSAKNFRTSSSEHLTRAERAAPEQRNIEARLLHWCSARGSGPLDSFVETFQWMQGDWSQKTRAYRSLRWLSALGHVEVDWHNSRWTVTPTTIVAPANAGGLAFVVGGQESRFVDQLAKVIEEWDMDVVLAEVPQVAGHGPSIQLLRAGSRQVLVDVAEAAAVPLAVDASHELAELLPTLDRMIRRGALPGGFERRRIEATDNEIRFVPAIDDQWDGSYEHDTFGAKIYSTSDGRTNDGPYLVDRSTAIWLTLRRQGSYPIRFDKDTRTLAVPTAFGLPLLHERALILSTGLLPSVVLIDDQRFFMYSNISAWCAQRLKETLSE